MATKLSKTKPVQTKGKIVKAVKTASERTNTALLKADCPGARNGLCYVAQDLLQSGS